LSIRKGRHQGSPFGGEFRVGQAGLDDRLVPEERPALVRGDNAFGNEGVMAEMEEIERLWRQGDWLSLEQGFDAVEGKLRLTGWSSERRGVVLRRRVKSSLAAEASNDNPQQELQFVERSDKAKLWEYAVLLTNADYSLEAMGQLYRDWADCENGFDELKNQWGAGAATPPMIWSAATCRRGPWR
jgi:hypothetical protein